MMQTLKQPWPKTLTITSVRYERVRNLGNYESQRFAAEAVVNPGEDPALVSQQLMHWVDQQLAVDSQGGDDF
jgi:hypothetical protein